MIPKTNIPLADDGLVSATGWITEAGRYVMAGGEPRESVGTGETAIRSVIPYESTGCRWA